ncbi:MAG: SEC-C metal-binding domain-containing protein [Pseudonocardiaceae bacterium]
MLSTGLITTDDLDKIGSSFRGQPFELAAELVDAVEQGRVADPADTGYALMLAAEIIEREGDLPGAQVLAERAVEAYRVCGDPDGYPRAYHAELLLQIGREDEAMAELTALRPLMSHDTNAVSYVSEALEEGGRPEIAVRWLTAELRAALQRRAELEPDRPEPDYERAAAMAFAMAQVRHRLRRNLGLPHDEHDRLADHLMDRVLDALDDDAPSALLFWPQSEFDQLLLRWPALAEDYGQTWEEYRTTLQRTLVLATESGAPSVGLLAGSVEELASYADRGDGDPTGPQVFQDYIRYLAEHRQEIAWPPELNQECWCGSSVKYEKCCLPRTRA